MLRALCSVELFQEHPGRRFGLTPLSELLRTGVAGSMRMPAALTSEPITWKAWSELGHSVRTGTPAFEKFFGKSVFEYFSQDPALAEAFSVGMAELTRAAGEAVLRAYDFKDIERLVDVGGGRGARLSAIIAAYPHIKGVLFDMAPIVAVAAVPPSVEIVSGSFFEFVPEGADAYTLMHILHDWSDEKCVQILSNCRAAMRDGGRVLIVENIVDDTPRGIGAKFNDLEMLVMSPNGRERTEAEFAALLEKAGLKLTRVVPTDGPVCVIEARTR